MKKIALLFSVIFLAGLSVKAQFGYVEKGDIETFKDTRLVVVLFNDSAYNASIQAAVEKYWSFNGGFIFVADTALKAYNKPEFSFLVFSKSKTTKMKAKMCSSELDMNGLVVSKKYKRKVTNDILIANAFCSNKIDTSDWYPEMVRGVQLLNNYFNLALTAGSNREISFSFMSHNYPTDKAPLTRARLYIDPKLLDLKSKEDVATLFDGSVEEIADVEEINKLIINQDPDAIYYYQVTDDKYCNKLFVSASGSELMYYDSGSKEKCKCTSKDIKALKSMRDKKSKEGE